MRAGKLLLRVNYFVLITTLSFQILYSKYRTLDTVENIMWNI